MGLFDYPLFALVTELRGWTLHAPFFREDNWIATRWGVSMNNRTKEGLCRMILRRVNWNELKHPF